MKMRFLPRPSLPLLTALALGLGSWTHAQNSAGDSLLSRSPFLPPGTPTRDVPPPDEAPPPSLQGYEFCGFFTVSDEVRLLIKAPNKPDGQWLRLREAKDQIEVTSFDLTARTIVLRSGTETMRLSMREQGEHAPTPIAGYAPPTNAQTANRGASPVRPTRRVVRPPRPSRPQWIQDRMREQGITAPSSPPPSAPPGTRVPTGGPGGDTGGGESTSDGPPAGAQKPSIPDFLPPPPPNFTPPGAE